jgi:hypothetical protein
LSIPDPDPDFLPIPDPGVKKALDPGSGSAILVLTGMCPHGLTWCPGRLSLDAVKLMSHSGQAALTKLGKSTKQPDQLRKDWNKTIQELGNQLPVNDLHFFFLEKDYM